MDKQEQIDRYLKGQMSSAEQMAFVSAMQLDESLRKEVKETEDAVNMLETAFIQKKASETLVRLYKEKPYRRKTGRVYRITFLSGVAASLALLYFAFWPISLPVIEDDLMVVRREEAVDSDTSVYNDLLRGYDGVHDRNYLGAITYLESVAGSEDLRAYFREAAQWHLALAYLKSDQIQKAEVVLGELSKLDHYEYPISITERWKLKFRVWMARI